jgi:hypothetical protein
MSIGKRLGSSAVHLLLLGFLAACTQQVEPGPEVIAETREEVRVDWFSTHKPVSVARACGAASDLAQVPSSFDSLETNLSELVVAQYENEWGRLQRVCEGTWEFPIPARVRDASTLVDSARIFIDELTSGSGNFEVVLYAGDGQPSLADFTAPPSAVQLGVMFSSSLHQYSGPSIAQAFEQLRSAPFLGVRIVPIYHNSPARAWARFQGIPLANPPAGRRAHLELDYAWEENTAPTISLVSPTNPLTVAHDQQVYLRAFAGDAEDGDLSSNVTWTSNISGLLGQGSLLYVTLVPGLHTLTATVTDTQGLTATQASALVTVESPPDPCAAAPGDVDRDGVCDALDRCRGYDDGRDGDADGTPDACDGLLTVGYAHTCANVTGGPLTCWGWNFYGQASPPAGETFKSITAGQVHTCGLRADGSARCWGDGRLGELAVPAGVKFTELTAGWSHTCGLLPDGSITCWGLNDKGQATPPAGNDFVSVKPGRFHTCALKRDGSITCWGYDAGFNRTLAPVGEYARLANHEVHGCALSALGTPKCWGSNGWNMSTPPAGVSFTVMSTAQYDTCGIDTAGNLRCFGGGFYGTNLPPAGAGHTQLAFFAKHACARAQSGGIECWGDQTGPGGSNAVPLGLR